MLKVGPDGTFHAHLGPSDKGGGGEEGCRWWKGIDGIEKVEGNCASVYGDFWKRRWGLMVVETGIDGSAEGD